MMYSTCTMNSFTEDDDAFVSEEPLRKTIDKRDNFKKFRNNSYHQAVKDSPRFSRNKFAAALSDEKRKKESLYQDIAEKAIFDSSMTEDDESNGLLVPSGDTNNRLSWGELPHVQESGILNKISVKEKKRQECMFELVTSEASYLRSLNILHEVFIMSEDLRHCVTHTEYHHLFSNLEAVRTCSRTFLFDLESRINGLDVAITDVCDIVIRHFTAGWFEPYITYCSSEVYQQRALQSLMSNNPSFRKAVKNGERNKFCSGLPLHSFLLLPLQRVTRLPLLIDTIRQKSDPKTSAYASASKALRETTRLVKTCNERARELQRTEDMIQLQRQLEFKSKSFALVAPTRYLLKKGKLVRVGGETVLGFRKVVRHEIHVLLFNDMLILAKKKGEENYVVTDFCSRHGLRMEELSDDPNGFYLTIEKNQDGRRVLLHLEADSPSSKARWLMSMRSITKRAPKVADKDCVQVRIIRQIQAVESDMISLQKMDVVAILESTVDGWYYGERLVDGEKGWFPSSYAKEILNANERERNMRRRTRLFGIETSI